MCESMIKKKQFPISNRNFSEENFENRQYDAPVSDLLPKQSHLPQRQQAGKRRARHNQAPSHDAQADRYVYDSEKYLFFCGFLP